MNMLTESFLCRIKTKGKGTVNEQLPSFKFCFLPFTAQPKLLLETCKVSSICARVCAEFCHLKLTVKSRRQVRERVKMSEIETFK